MSDVLQLRDCLDSGLVSLERVNYFPRQLLSVDDMEAECKYFRQKLRRHNRFLHGWGIVCGLEVSDAAPNNPNSSNVQISPGYALGPYGDEIFVPSSITLDLTKCLPGAATDPCQPNVVSGGTPGTGTSLYIAIKYAECLAKPVRAMPAGCACDDEDCQYSRVRDSFQISCLTVPPDPSGVPSLCDFTNGKVRSLTCPPCPTSPWVYLAQVTFVPPTVIQ